MSGVHGGVELPPRSVIYLVEALTDTLALWGEEPAKAPFEGFELDRAIAALSALSRALEDGDQVVIPAIQYGTLRRDSD